MWLLNLIFWTWFQLMSALAHHSLLQRVVTQIVDNLETNMFEHKKCDLHFLGTENIEETINFETLENPIVLMNGYQDISVNENLQKLSMMNSKCLILLTIVKNGTNVNLIQKIIGPRKDSIVISLPPSKVKDVWSKYDLDRFPRNIVEVSANQLQTHIFLGILCVQNMDHVMRQNVNLWVSKLGPVKSLTEALPNHVCPHPLYKKKLRAGYINSRPFVFLKQSAEYGLGGIEMSLLKLLREKFQFEMSFVKDAIGEYNTSTKKWTGMFGMLHDNELDLRISTCKPRLIYEYTTLIFYADLKWISRKPIPITKYDQFLIPFSKSVWAAMVATLLVLSVLFALFYKIYQSQSFNGHSFTGYLAHPVDFFLITISALMEPDPMCWFPRLSAGRLLILLWCILSLNINNFYTSNLRADLMRQDYEKEIDTAADVVERDQTVYIPLSTYNAFFKNQTFENPIMQKAISLAVDRNGVYESGLPEVVKRAMFDKGSILTVIWLNVLGQSFTNKDMSADKLHVGKESILGWNIVYCVKKDTTWIVDFDRIIGRAFDMGIIDFFIKQELPKEANMAVPKGDASDEVMPIMMEQILSMGFFLCIGFGLSLFAMMFELLALLSK